MICCNVFQIGLEGAYKSIIFCQFTNAEEYSIWCFTLEILGLLGLYLDDINL